jgi:hypothetical protein
MTKILIICDLEFYKYFVEYFDSLKKYLDITIFTHNNNLELAQPLLDTHDIIIITILEINQNNIKDIIKKPYFVLNSEQLTRWKDDSYIKDHKLLLDYSIENVRYANEKYSRHNINYLPYGYNSDEVYNYEKVNNICMITASRIRRRRTFLKFRCKRFPITIIESFGKVRDEILFRHKIMLNVHFDTDYGIHEVIRCDRCVFNKMIVISEKSFYNDIKLRDFMIFTDYNKMYETAVDVLKNYDYYYNKLFVEQDFDLFITNYKNELHDIYNAQISEMVNKISVNIN